MFPKKTVATREIQFPFLCTAVVQGTYQGNLVI